METQVSRERMIAFLLVTPLFERLEPSELMEIIHIVEVRQYRAGDIIFREGDKGDAWYVIYKGAVEVLKQAEAGEKKVAELGPESCFGEIAILDGSPRSASIRATRDCVVFRVARDAFNKLVEKGHLAAYKLLHSMAILLAKRQRITTLRLTELVNATEITAVHRELMDIVGESSVRE